MIKQPFYISKLKSALIHKTGLATVVEVFLDRKDFIEDLKLDKHGISTIPWIIKITNRKNPANRYLKNQLSIFEKTGKATIANSKHPVRWLGSGIILLLNTPSNDKFLVVYQRVNCLTRNNYFTGSGGYSSSLEDMLDPITLAQRELVEEVVIKINTKIVDLKSTKLNILTVKNPTKVVVHFEGQDFITDNIHLIIDPETATIDFRQIWCLNVDSIDNITLLDGETRFVSKKKERLQKRPILIFDLKDIKKVVTNNQTAIPRLGFLNNRKMVGKDLKKYKLSLRNMTPALKSTLIGYYC